VLFAGQGATSMKPETKLWLRKKALMTLRAIIWHADEWLHRQEVKLRNDLCACKTCSEVAAPTSARPRVCEDMLHQQPGRARSENFQQWEARRSGIAVVSKKESRRRRQLSASAFDLRFSSR